MIVIDMTGSSQSLEENRHMAEQIEKAVEQEVEQRMAIYRQGFMDGQEAAEPYAEIPKWQQGNTSDDPPTVKWHKWRDKTGRIVAAYQWWGDPDGIVDSFSPTSNNRVHEPCGWMLLDHGVLVDGDAEFVVCPSDWIVTSHYGTYLAVKSNEFTAHYEKVSGDE